MRRSVTSAHFFFWSSHFQDVCSWSWVPETKPHRETHTSLSLPSRLILSLPLGFSVLAHDERLADANDRKQDLFSSFQQIFCWRCLRVEALTLQQPLVSRSLSLSLSFHIRTQTHTITQKMFFLLPYTLDSVMNLWFLFYFPLDLSWLRTSLTFIGVVGSHLQKWRLLGKQTNRNKESLFLNIAITMTMCVCDCGRECIRGKLLSQA